MARVRFQTTFAAFSIPSNCIWLCFREVICERVFVGKPEQNDNNDFHLKFNIVMVYSAVKSIGKSIEFFYQF